jgi:hypothetical protein
LTPLEKRRGAVLSARANDLLFAVLSEMPQSAGKYFPRIGGGRYLRLPNTSFRRSVARAAGLVRIFFSSCATT